MNVLNGNMTQIACYTLKFRNHKFAIRKLVDKHECSSDKMLLILQRGRFLLLLLAAVLRTLATLFAM